MLDARRQELVRVLGREHQLAKLDPKRRKLAELRERIEYARPVFHASSRDVSRLSAPGILTPAWYSLRPHPEHHRLWTSTARFRVVPAGRRSGKTELSKRFLVGTAACAHSEARFFAAAPTEGQAKKIWWSDLKKLTPPWMLQAKSDSELWLRLINGAEIHVVGTDVPERLEGTSWDGGVLDEYGNMHPDVWPVHLRPVMAERNGWCWMIGVPEGRNHYYGLYRQAMAQATARKYLTAGRHAEALDVLRSAFGEDAEKLISAGINALEWDVFTWSAEDILPPHEIAAARRDMAEDQYEQEFLAKFTAFRGRVYQAFRAETHCAPLAHRYNPREPLLVYLDFNVAPGVAAIGQEMSLPSGHRGTAIIGEVHVPYDSTTEIVCRKLVEDWAGHQGPVMVYGDATGGQRRTEAKESGGTNWKIVTRMLRPSFGRLVMRVPRANPTERDRINTMNARIRSMDGAVKFMVDPARAPHVAEDFEGVRYLEGTSEIAKSGAANVGLTHHSDAVGYGETERHPIPDHSASGTARATEYLLA